MAKYTLSIEAIRVNMGLSQKEFAQKVGVSHVTVSHWENGRTTIDSEKLYRISEISGVPVQDIRLIEKSVKKV